jgi:hypothetical protein
VKPRRRQSYPYREPSPLEDEERAVPTCEEMRRRTGTANAVLLAVAAAAIAWAVIGR